MFFHVKTNFWVTLPSGSRKTTFCQNVTSKIRSHISCLGSHFPVSLAWPGCISRLHGVYIGNHMEKLLMSTFPWSCEYEANRCSSRKVTFISFCPGELLLADLAVGDMYWWWGPSGFYALPTRSTTRIFYSLRNNQPNISAYGCFFLTRGTVR